jgi:hypothetical protein
MVKIHKKFLILFSVLFSFYLALPSWAGAAQLYLEPSSLEVSAGETFMVDIKIDSEGECINAVETGLIFPKDILEHVDFSKGKSILSLWAKEPTFSVISCDETKGSCGLVEFSGGIPNGYCGRIPGDPGPSNLLGQIIFRVPGMAVRELNNEQLSGEIKFTDNSQVLLNDGLGTPAKLVTQEAAFHLVSKSEPAKDEWKEKLTQDKTPPEAFEIQVLQDPNIFEGKYFIIFQTTDKQTGISHYEVKEGKRDWQKAESPYLLEDQNLRSIIKVKAVDKAGNERIAEYTPLKVTKRMTKETLTIIGLVILLIISLIVKKYLFKNVKKDH